jgi:hypothetical protein
MISRATSSSVIWTVPGDPDLLRKAARRFLTAVELLCYQSPPPATTLAEPP